MIKRGFTISTLIFLLTASVAGEITRVAFTKPGYMMKIPTSSIYRTPYIFRTGIGTEIYGTVDTLIARGVFFESDLSNTFKLGITCNQGLGSDAPVEFGFHFQKRLFVYGDISFAAGIHDLVLKQGSKELNIDTKTLSLFGIISNEKQFTNSSLFTYMGFGTGGLASGFGSDSTTRAGVFAGVLLHTRIMEEKGGVEFIAEFDGGGVNAGVKLPITKDYNLNLGVSNLIKLYNWGAEDFNTASLKDYPGFNVGLDFRIPRIKPETARQRKLEGMVDEETQMILDMEQQFATKLDSTLKAADYEIALLKDSLKIYESEIKHLTSQIAQLRQKTAVLEDSVRSAKLAKHAMEQNINLALKHLSRSLRFFYQNDYREALQEVDAAIELNSNLALAYARRGSIYYKLGDIDRATINWNLALRIDPEYDDVRNILRALSENRLRSAGSSQKE